MTRITPTRTTAMMTTTTTTAMTTATRSCSGSSTTSRIASIATTTMTTSAAPTPTSSCRVFWLPRATIIFVRSGRCFYYFCGVLGFASFLLFGRRRSRRCCHSFCGRDVVSVFGGGRTSASFSPFALSNSGACEGKLPVPFLGGCVAVFGGGRGGGGRESRKRLIESSSVRCVGCFLRASGVFFLNPIASRWSDGVGSAGWFVLLAATHSLSGNVCLVNVGGKSIASRCVLLLVLFRVERRNVLPLQRVLLVSEMDFLCGRHVRPQIAEYLWSAWWRRLEQLSLPLLFLVLLL